MEINKNPYALSRLMFIIQADLEYLVNLLVNGAFLATLTSHMGMSDSLTGIISAFASLGCLFQMLSIFFRKVNVKKFVIFLSIANQGLFMLLYFIPIGSKTNLTIALFCVCIFMALLLYNIAHPKKIDWFMSMVAEEKRGIFTANKEIASLLSGMIFNFFMGALIDHFKEKGDMRTALLLGGATLFVLSVLHTIAMIFTKNKGKSLSETTQKSTNIFSFFKHKKILKISLVTLFWYVSYYSTVSFYGTYQIKELGFSLKFISIITIFSLVARILVSRFWGIYADKHSFAKMVCWCFSITALGHFAMIFAVPSNGKVLYTFYLICTAVGQGGIGSALINICYDYVPYSKRSDALAFSNAIGGSAGFLITFLISPLVQHIQNNGNNFFGINVYAQQVISLIALLIEIFAIIYIARCVVPLTRIRGKITYD